MRMSRSRGNDGAGRLPAIKLDVLSDLRESLAKVTGHIVNEAVHRNFRDAVADDRVHGLS